MTIILLVFILIGVPYFIFRKKYRAGLILSIFNLAFILLIASGVLTQILINGLQTYAPVINPTWKDENLIVLLTAGSQDWKPVEHYSSQISFYPRQYEAARLYSNCKKYALKCKILISGGDPAQVGKAESEIAKEELLLLDIPSSDILTENKSNNTFENASFSSQIINTLAENLQIYLVTSHTHMKRSLKCFSFFKINPIPAPADLISIRKSWKYLYQNVYIADLALHEYLGYFKVILQDITENE